MIPIEQAFQLIDENCLALAYDNYTAGLVRWQCSRK